MTSQAFYGSLQWIPFLKKHFYIKIYFKRNKTSFFVLKNNLRRLMGILDVINIHHIKSMAEMYTLLSF